jgi:lysophospholipase L1-like esterase
MVQRLSGLLDKKAKSEGRKHFDIVIILGGTNDLGQHPRDGEGILVNLCALHEAVHRTGGKTCVVTVPFIRTQKFVQEVDADRCWLNASLREYARRRPNQTLLIDLAAAIPQDHAHAALWSPDWVHLSAAGYEAMGDVIGAALRGMNRAGATSPTGAAANSRFTPTAASVSNVAVGDWLEYNSPTKGDWIECQVLETRVDGSFMVDVKPQHWFAADQLEQHDKFRRKEPFIIMCLPEMSATQAPLDRPKGVRLELEPHDTDPSSRGLLINWDVPAARVQVSQHTVELKRSGLEDNIVARAELKHPYSTAMLSRIAPGHCYFVSVAATAPSGAQGRKWGAIISLPWTADDPPPPPPRSANAPTAPRPAQPALPPDVVQELLVMDAVPPGQKAADPSKGMIYVTWSAPCTWKDQKDRSVFRHRVTFFNGVLPAGGWSEEPIYTKLLEGTAASFALGGFMRGPVYTVGVSIIGPQGEGPPVYASVTLAPLGQDA